MASIGLTVALFVSGEAFKDDRLQGEAKLGALLSGLMGAVCVGIAKLPFWQRNHEQFVAMDAEKSIAAKVVERMEVGDDGQPVKRGKRPKKHGIEEIHVSEALYYKHAIRAADVRRRPSVNVIPNA